MEDVTKLRIVEYLKDKGVQEKVCSLFLLPSRIRGIRSARVRVPLEFKNIVLESNSWPEDIRVRSWVFRPKMSVSENENNQYEDVN